MSQPIVDMCVPPVQIETFFNNNNNNCINMHTI